MKKTILLLIVLFLSSRSSYAQLEDRFNFLNTENIVKYLQPMATSIGTSLNSAGYHTASTSKNFGFSIGVKGMAIFIPSDQLTFTPTVPAGYSTNIQSATIYGNKGAYIAGKSGYTTYPPGINQKLFPMVFPQATISTLGTELLVRFMTGIKVGGKDLNFFGFGIKHSLSQYLIVLPLDVAVQALYTKFDIKDLITSTNFALNAQASKTLGMFTVYGGLQYEKSSFEIDYTTNGDIYNADPELRVSKPVKTTIEGKNKFRITAGTSLKLAVLVLNVDYSISNQSVLTAGLSLVF
jgi:hypothetical protein